MQVANKLFHFKVLKSISVVCVILTGNKGFTAFNLLNSFLLGIAGITLRPILRPKCLIKEQNKSQKSYYQVNLSEVSILITFQLL